MMSRRQPGRVLFRLRSIRRSQCGSASVEMALLVPAMVIVLGLLISGGRLWFARTTVSEAASAAARAASLSRSSTQAAADGNSAARQSMSTAGLACASASVRVDAAGFSVEVGTPASVAATVTCRVPFADILLPGMPGSIELIQTGTSALDTYRSRR